MRAVTVIPGQPGSVTLTDMPEPPPDNGPVLVQTQAIGICGTDLEIINGDYGWAPPGQDRPVVRRWLRHVGERDGAWLPGDDGDGAHDLTIANEAGSPG